MSDNRAIGIFDSGVGGLTVTREIISLLPHENVVYFGDVGRTPYGGRSREIITHFTRQDLTFLMEQNVKFIICACNTASAVALEEISQDYSTPMIGVIKPGAEAAVQKTKNGNIGVIGTLATINSNAYAKQIHKIDPKMKVYSLACPLFVPMVEEGYTDKEATFLIARDYLQTMHDVEIDTLVLGCTHYSLLKDVISDVMGEKIQLVASAEEISKSVYQYLADNDLMNAQTSQKPGPTGDRKFFVSDVPDKFTGLASRFLGTEVENATRVDISVY